MTSDPSDLRRYIVTEGEAEVYYPPAHSDTSNMLYLPQGFMGSKQFEVAIGRAKPGGGGHPHYHEHAEQIVFVLQGHGESEMEGKRFPIGPRTLIFHPPGQMHRELATSDDFQALVIYSPGIGIKNQAVFQTRKV
jgi:mannose-6-phosphate isomerase-like protein (cupin superfamily)